MGNYLVTVVGAADRCSPVTDGIVNAAVRRALVETGRRRGWVRGWMGEGNGVCVGLGTHGREGGSAGFFRVMVILMGGFGVDFFF